MMQDAEVLGGDAPDFAEVFSYFASNLKLDALPLEVVEAASTNLYDTLACAMAGASAPGVAEMVELIGLWGGRKEASVWCSGLRVPAHHAALINGMMAHARDFDDTHDAAVLHAGVSVIPAALAAAELRPEATGADLLCGIVVGLELICRLGTATTIGIVESGYMYTSLFGHFAATAAAARVLGFNHDQMVNALGIAYSQAAGNHQVTRDAALTKRIQPGFAAKTALISTAMTRAGIRGVQRTFEGEDGLFRTYLRGNYDPTRLREGLGQHFTFLGLSYKPYPCCRFNHTAIDAALKIRPQIMGRQVRRAVAYVNRQAWSAVGVPIEMRQSPDTIVQAQFSIPYTVACALVKGDVTLTDFTHEGLFDPAVRELAAKINVQVDDEIEREWSRNVSPTRLVVDTDDGEVGVRIDLPRGNASAPMSRDDFDRKMRGCLAISGIDWPEGAEERLRAAIDGLAASASALKVVHSMLPESRSEKPYR